MVGTDIGEAVARYLRALYETTPPGERAATVYQRYADLHYLAPSLSLHAIAGTRREEPADLSLFRSAWIDVLAANTDGIWAASRQRLLTEAAVWQGGIDGLAEVARRPGTHQPTTYLDWIDALAGADRLADAGAAAREGLALVDLPGERAADMADRLAKAPALGWSRPGHPGAVVLPYLMVAATGQPVPPCTTILGRHFAAIDAIGSRDATPSAGGSPGGEEASGQNTDDQTGRPATPQVPLSTLLAQRLSTQAVPPQRQQWLALAQATVEQRVDAVVTRKHRGAYARVAELAAACAETLTLCQGTTAGEAFLTLIRNRYPRHIAFRRELDTAIRTSSLLPPPPGRHH